MSILSYEENGQTYWKYYLNRRSKKNPRIRLQRMQRGFKSRKEAKALHEAYFSGMGLIARMMSARLSYFSKS